MTLTAADVLGSSLVASLPESMRLMEPERIEVHRAPYLLTKLWGSMTAAITLRNHIFVASDVLAGGGRPLRKLVIHELAHVEQWSRQGVSHFLLAYVGQYSLARLRGASHHVAYMSITAEVEARQATLELRPLLDDD